MEDTTWSAILERLLVALHANSEAALGPKLGISSQAIYNAKKKQQVPPAWVFQAAKTYGVSADWIFFGRKNTLCDTKKDEIAKDSSIICDVDLRLIPMVEARISAGQGSLETSGKSERSYAFRMDFLLRKGNPEQMVMMRVAGDSMEPEIYDGDVVLLDQSQRDVLPGRIYAVGFEDAIYLKRIDKEPGKVILKSMNPNYRPVTLDVREDCAEQFRVIGKVLWSGREYR
jgi:phage repressor protein C with HTH and peptisase S24 domain